MAERMSKDLKKFLAAKRAQFRLKQQLDLIDFIEDELEPIKADAKGKKIKVSMTNEALSAKTIGTKIKVKELDA